MSESRTSQRKVGFTYSPLVSIILSIIAAVSTVGSVLVLSRISTTLTGGPFPAELDATMQRIIARPWLSVLLGMAVGLPYIVRQKHSLRQHMEHNINNAILTREERRRKPFHLPDVVDCVFVVLTPAVAGGLAYLLHIAWLPAFLAPGILSFLAYPEMKDIYDTARSRLAEQVSPS